MAEMTQREWQEQRDREKESAARERMREQESRRDERERDRKADSILTQAQRDTKQAFSDAEKASEKLAAETQKQVVELEKKELGQPRTVRTGGTRKNAKLIPVWHWQTEMAGLKSKPADAPDGHGPLLYLQPGGGIPSNQFADDALFAKRPELKSSAEHIAWARDKVRPALQEAKKRYPILPKLRDDDWFARLAEDTGIATSTTEDEPWEGTVASGTRKLTRVSIPSLTGVVVGQDGLELTFAHRPGDTADRWTRCLPALRAAFKASGVSADNLRVTEDHAGNIVLRFDDAPSSFPSAVAPPVPAEIHSAAEAIRNYPKLHWEFGVDARGNILQSRVADSPHVALIAQTGWGKSILSSTIVEQMRTAAGAMVMLFDGKATDHPRSLGRSPGVIWLSKSPAEHMVGMAWAHAEMEERYQQVDAANDSDETTKDFSFVPIFILVDELPSLRGSMKNADTKDKGALFDWMLTDILQKGRQCRIHAMLISQSLYVESLPSSMQTNITRTIFLGPVEGRSLLSDDIPQDAKDKVVNLSSRVTEEAKGRAVFMGRTPSGMKVTQFQGFFGYSPGNTSLDDAPNAEVRAAWTEAKRIGEKLPRLYDRIGIKVEGPDWRDQPMEELAETPTVIVADENGPIPGMEVYDQLSSEFKGAIKVGSNSNRARGRGAASGGKTTASDAKASDNPTPDSPPPPPQPDPKTTPPPNRPGATQAQLEATMRYTKPTAAPKKQKPTHKPQTSTVNPEQPPAPETNGSGRRRRGKWQ